MQSAGNEVRLCQSCHTVFTRNPKIGEISAQASLSVLSAVDN